MPHQRGNATDLGAHEHGAYAEYVKLPADHLIPLPGNVSFEQAAAFPNAFGTAWHMLMGRGDLRVYLLVQLYPLLALPFILLLFPPRYTRTGDLVGATSATSFALGDAVPRLVAHYVPMLSEILVEGHRRFSPSDDVTLHRLLLGGIA